MARKQPEGYAACDPATVAPVTSEGKPDMYNYMPTRFVPIEEAKARGWPLYYDGTICRYGHVAPHYVSNTRLCVDCKRLREGKAEIGGKAQAEWKKPPRKQPESPPSTPGIPVAALAKALEPDRQEKAFIEAYAACRSFDGAALAINVAPSVMQGRLAWSAPFKQAVADLEARLGIRPTPPAPLIFVWDADKRARLIEVLVDTGDMATARDAIRVTPSQFYKEVERNQQFASDLEAAMPLAAKALEERATQLALAGNDKLLTKILSAKLPEYREHVKVDLNVTEKLTDDQLNNRLARLFAKHRNRIIDGECEPVEPQGQIAAPGDAGGDRSAGVPQSVLDLL